jgi:hypothetical protein
LRNVLGVEELAVESGGWVWYLGVWLRFSPDETGQWRLREIAAEDGDYLSITRLNDLRLPDLGVRINTDPHVQSQLRADADISPDVVAAGVTVGTPVVDAFDDNYRLEGPPGPDGLTDDFLRRVGTAYAAACLRHEAPCKAIAQDVKVSPRTAQRWTYVARKRGMMPRAQAKGARG